MKGVALETTRLVPEGVRQFCKTVPAILTKSFIYYLSMGGVRGLAVAYLYMKTRLAKRLTVMGGRGREGERGKKSRNGQILLRKMHRTHPSEEAIGQPY